VIAFVILASCASQKNSALKSDSAPSPDSRADGSLSSGDLEARTAFERLERDVAFYKSRYQLPDVFQKLVNDRGNGFESLYGVRNFREVLSAVYYRGGANNRYHRRFPRNNMNPLPEDGLENLCAEGFVTGLYFYEQNFKTAKPQTSCRNRSTGEETQLDYAQITAFSIKDFSPFLQIIYDRIKGKVKGPIYGHCWNGWHASGLMATIALKQFCDFSNSQADDYWVRNTDGNSKGHESLRRKIQNFVPIPGLSISEAEKKLICPR
jgi:hypothetical protein